ncbi:MAG: hypothetical protein JRE23_08730 [Deltaproteobacteria bacterium]|nr:hypothetical protein [Deltaproteobacteria bacterium]
MGMPEPGTLEYEDMVDFIRKDLESGMRYTKLIKAAKDSIEARGGNFDEEFDRWKKERRRQYDR